MNWWQAIQILPVNQSFNVKNDISITRWEKAEGEGRVPGVGGWGGGGRGQVAGMLSSWYVVHVVHVSTTYLMKTTLKGLLRFFLSATKIL